MANSSNSRSLFGRRLRAARERLGLPQDKLGGAFSFLRRKTQKPNIAVFKEGRGRSENPNDLYKSFHGRDIKYH